MHLALWIDFMASYLPCDVFPKDYSFSGKRFLAFLFADARLAVARGKTFPYSEITPHILLICNF